MAITYMMMLHYTRNKNMHDLGVGMTMVLEILSNFPNMGLGKTQGTISNVLYILLITLNICI